MTFDNVLTIHNKTETQIIRHNLDNLGNKLYGKENWFYTQSYNSETSVLQSGELEYVTIGKIPLIFNCDDEEYNRAGYVYLIKDMYHEHQHIWLGTNAQNDKLNLNTIRQYRQITDLIRREFISSYFPSVYMNNYSNHPGEMYAEGHGIRRALVYFESDSIVTKQEAEEILYQFTMADDYMHNDLIAKHKGGLKTIYDVIKLFDEQVYANNDRYDVTMDLDPYFRDNPDLDLTMTDRFLHDKEFKEHRKAFNACETGIQQDKVLEQVILFARPNAIKHAPPRLKNELKECMKQMELSTLRPGLHAVPPKHINYAKNVIQEEELMLTEEDLASIQMGDGSVTL